MRYTMTLTHRHGYPWLTSIYPDVYKNGQHKKNWFQYLTAYFDFFVQSDATELEVCMSGFPLYKKHLIAMCVSRGITLIMLYPTKNGKKVHKEQVTPDRKRKEWFESIPHWLKSEPMRLLLYSKLFSASIMRTIEV